MMRDPDREKLLLDRERLELDKQKLAFEQRFLNRNLTAIVTLVISLATTVLTVTQIYLSHTQHERDAEAAKERQNVEWRIKGLDFVTQHAGLASSKDQKVHLRMVAQIQAIFPQDVRESVLTALENMADPSQKDPYGMARTLDSVRANTPLEKSALMDLSRKLQVALRRHLLDYYFSDPKNANYNPFAAAVLTYAALPVTTSVEIDGGTVLRLNTDKDFCRNWPAIDLLRAMVKDPHTIETLRGDLAGIQSRLPPAESGTAPLFDPSRADNFVLLAQDSMGSIDILKSLLFFESSAIGAAADAAVKNRRTQIERQNTRDRGFAQEPFRSGPEAL
jgi:hypothetical protein